MCCHWQLPFLGYTVNGLTVNFNNTSQNGTAYEWTFGMEVQVQTPILHILIVLMEHTQCSYPPSMIVVQ